MRVDWETEICVIGGGPAGSTIARRLARFGHEVLLVEQHDFPRPHVGESLSPSILPVLDALGVRDRIQSGPFLRPHRVLIRWCDQTTYVKWQPNEPGFQVDRGPFDLLLLQIALEAGVKLLQPARALRPIRDVDAGWIVPLQHEGRVRYTKTGFLVDASGRQSRIWSKRLQKSPPTLALYGYWYDTDLEGSETRVEAGSKNWFWGAPLPFGTFNATVFLDPKRIKVAHSNDLESFYRGLLSESTLLRACLKGKLADEVKACNASSYQDEAPVGESFIKVGEASFAVDPLSSQGVQLAMLSALQASIVCHTILTVPANAPAAMRFYRERQAEAVNQHSEWAARYYAEQQSFNAQEFWERRAQRMSTSPARPPKKSSVSAPSKGCRIQVSKEVTIVETPVIHRETIRLAPAIAHPALDRPVAFLNNVPVAPLLGAMVSGETLGDTLEKWSQSVSEGTALQILRWMWSRQLIVPFDSVTTEACSQQTGRLHRF
jgi:flavin-dependent dehydrogenase